MALEVAIVVKGHVVGQLVIPAMECVEQSSRYYQYSVAEKGKHYSSYRERQSTSILGEQGSSVV